MAIVLWLLEYIWSLTEQSVLDMILIDVFIKVIVHSVFVEHSYRVEIIDVRVKN